MLQIPGSCVHTAAHTRPPPKCWARVSLATRTSCRSSLTLCLSLKWDGASRRVPVLSSCLSGWELLRCRLQGQNANQCSVLSAWASAGMSRAQPLLCGLSLWIGGPGWMWQEAVASVQLPGSTSEGIWLTWHMLLCMSDGGGLYPFLSPQTSHGSGNLVVLTGKRTRDCSLCGVLRLLCVGAAGS